MRTERGRGSVRVLSVVWNLIRGGTEGQCARVALALARHGYVHRVAVFRRDGFFLPPVEDACHGLYHFDVRRAVSPGTLNQLLKLRRWIRMEDIHLVHTWDADAAIFASLAAQWAGVPFITSRRDLGQIYPAWKLRAMARADRKAGCVVVNADAIRSELVHRGLPHDRIVTIPNMMDLDEFDRLAQSKAARWAHLPAGRKVGMVARLDPEKDAATYIRAAALLAETYPDVHFLIAGDGKQRSWLESLVLELGLSERVLFLGEVDDVPSLVRVLDMGVLVPSANEGLSNTVLEYMAAAKPAVVTDCGGNRELVADGENGMVIPIGDHVALANAVDSLLKDKGRANAMGQIGRDLVVQNHSPDMIADRFAALYDRVGG